MTASASDGTQAFRLHPQAMAVFESAPEGTPPAAKAITVQSNSRPPVESQKSTQARSWCHSQLHSAQYASSMSTQPCRSACQQPNSRILVLLGHTDEKVHARYTPRCRIARDRASATDFGPDTSAFGKDVHTTFGYILRLDSRRCC
jgi:hypothetical protein